MTNKESNTTVLGPLSILSKDAYQYWLENYGKKFSAANTTHLQLTILALECQREYDASKRYVTQDVLIQKFNSMLDQYRLLSRASREFPAGSITGDYVPAYVRNYMLDLRSDMRRKINNLFKEIVDFTGDAVPFEFAAKSPLEMVEKIDEEEEKIRFVNRWKLFNPKQRQEYMDNEHAKALKMDDEYNKAQNMNKVTPKVQGILDSLSDLEKEALVALIEKNA